MVRRTPNWSIRPIILVLLFMGTALAPLQTTARDPIAVNERVSGIATWPMFARDGANTGLDDNVSRGVMDPYKVWDNGILDCLGSTVGDLSGNIVLDGVSSYDRKGLQGVYSRGNALQIVEGSTGTLMWSVSIGVNIKATSGLTDTDFDGRLEIAISTIDGNVSLYEPLIRWNGTAYNYNQTSAQNDRIWTRNLGEAVLYSSITLGDLSKDGIDDILLAGQSRLHALNGTNGAWLWNASLTGLMTGTPIIVNFGSNNRRVAVSSYDPTTNQLHVNTYDSKGQNLNNITISTDFAPFQPVLLPPSLAAGDLDGDNSQEIVVLSPFESGGAKVRALEFSLDPLWSAPFQVSGQFSASPAVGDLDKDGDDDIVVVSESNPFNPISHVFGIEGSTGARLWNHTVDQSRAIASPILGDMDSDGRPDAVVPLNSGVIYGLNGTNGDQLWSFNTQHIGLASSPAIADMDGNGIADILVDGMDIGHRIVDLSIVEGDMTFDNGFPEEGDTIHISALVHNYGSKDVIDGKVRFIDRYDNSQTTIGTDLVNVSYGDTAEAAMDHFIEGGGGHTIMVVLDPDDDLDELSEINNKASKDINVSSHWSLGLSSTTGPMIVDPGDQAIFNVEVTNSGDMGNVIGLQVSSTLPQGWTAGPTVDEVDLPPGSSKNILFIVTTSTSAVGGDHMINLTGTSKNKTSNHNTLSTITTIRGDYGLKVTTGPISQNINREGFAFYHMNLSNLGNAQDVMDINNTPPVNSSWTVLLSEYSVSLGSMEHGNVTLTVKPPNDANVDDAEVIEVNITSRGDPSQRMSITFTTRIVKPDLATLSMTFFRKDGLEVNGTSKHLISNRTSTVVIDVKNLLGNVDSLQDVMLELYTDGVLLAYSVVDIRTGAVETITIDTAFKSGSQLVMACIDANFFIDETSEANNCLSINITVRSDTSVGPYSVHGTVLWPSGAKLANAHVSILNVRTNESFKIDTDNQGHYSVDLMDLPSKYQEEEEIEVSASDEVTEVKVSFLAYSEDLGKKVDIVLEPGPYDFFIGPQKKVATEPGNPALFGLTVSQLGNASQLIDLGVGKVPSGWDVRVLDDQGTHIDNISVQGGQAVNFSVWVTPAMNARANSAGETLELTGTSKSLANKSFTVLLIVEVLQVHDLNATARGGSAIRGQSAKFNVSIRNDGNGDEVVLPTIGTNPNGWDVIFSKQRLNLSYKATENLDVVVNIPQNATTGTSTLHVVLSYGNDQHFELALDIEVLENDYSFTVVNNDLGQRNIVPGNSVDFNISLINDGNTDNTISLYLSGTPKYWTSDLRDAFGVSVTSIDLEMGETKDLVLEVTSPSETKGTKSAVITISAASMKRPSEQSSALALLTVYAADIVPLSNINFSQKRILDGDEVQISVEVGNIGTAPAKNTLAEFFIDNKSIGTVPIPTLSSNGRANVSISWDAKQGRHTVLIKLAPSSDLVEMNYLNNDIKVNINVEASSSMTTIFGIAIMVILIMVIITLIVLYYRRPDLLQFLSHDRREDDVEEDYEDDDEDDVEEDYEDDDEDDDEEDYEDDDEEEIYVIKDHHVVEEIVDTPSSNMRSPRPKKRYRRRRKAGANSKKGRSSSNGRRKRGPAKGLKKKKVVRKRKAHKTTASGKKIARPWTFHEDDLADNEEDGGIVRFG